MRKKHLLFLVLTLSLGLISSGIIAQTICTLNDYVDVNGYRVWNNPGSSNAGPQCIQVNGNGFTVTSNTDGGGGSYPEVFKGCHWGTWCTSNSGMPVQVSSLSSLPSNWSIGGTSAPGDWNAAYDIWIDQSPGVAPNGVELMIWLNWKGNHIPAGSVIASNISIDGSTWDLYQAQFSGWIYIAYRRTSTTTSFNGDLKAFMNDLANRGIMQNSWWVDAVEVGFEIGTVNNSGVGLVSNNGFSVTVNTGSSSSYVQLQNRTTGLMMDGMGRTSNGSNCGQWSNSGSYNQEWTIESDGSYVRLKNRATGLYIDGMGSTSNGAVAAQWGNSNSNNQQWQEVTSGSYVKFKNRATGLYLDGMGRTSNGSDLGQWSSSINYNQQWSVIAAKEAEKVIKPAENADVKIYPNPVSGSPINIALQGMTGTTQIRLIDPSGKIVKELQSNDKKLIRMDLNISPGVYIMQVINGQQNLFKKVIIE